MDHRARRRITLLRDSPVARPEATQEVMLVVPARVATAIRRPLLLVTRRQ